MTHAVLLSAGQGKRLSPLTDTRPKCLVPVGGRSILEWQLHALHDAGVEQVTVVTGFESRSVDAALKLTGLPIRVETRLNPFFSVADNIGSVWTARDLLTDDAVLINGDTLFDARILTGLLARASQPITVTIDRKPAYDSDDMKVMLKEGDLARIGKTLTGQIDGESIGMIRFQDGGGARFVAAMEGLLRDPASLKLWYLSIIDRLAADGGVGVFDIAGLPWAEVDFPSDLPIAGDRVARFAWRKAPETMTAAAERRELGS